jgi:hypothetical protein
MLKGKKAPFNTAGLIYSIAYLQAKTSAFNHTFQFAGISR